MPLWTHSISTTIIRQPNDAALNQDEECWATDFPVVRGCLVRILISHRPSLSTKLLDGRELYVPRRGSQYRGRRGSVDSEWPDCIPPDRDVCRGAPRAYPGRKHPTGGKLRRPRRHGPRRPDVAIPSDVRRGSESSTARLQAQHR